MLLSLSIATRKSVSTAPAVSSGKYLRPWTFTTLFECLLEQYDWNLPDSG